MGCGRSFSLNSIDLAIRGSGGVDGSIAGHGDCLNFELGGLQKRGELALRSDAINPGWSASSSKKIALGIAGDAPYIGRGRGGYRTESRGQFEHTFAANGYSSRCALFEVIKGILLPGTSGLRKGADSEQKHGSGELFRDFHSGNVMERVAERGAGEKRCAPENGK